MGKVKVAILGQGRSGRDIHATTLAKMPEKYEIVAAVDVDPQRCDRARREYNCEAYSSYQELLRKRDIDLVVNALPSVLHVPVSKEFLQAGFNVLSEKPVARYTAEVDALLDVAQKGGKTFAVFQQSRFSPAFQKLKQIIQSGVLGRLVQVNIAYNGFARRWDWQTLRSMNGGNLLNTGPHPVDQALQLFGTDVMPNVFCRMDSANSYGDAEDYVKLVLYGEGRPNVDVEISSCSAYPLFTYHIQGTKGGLMGNTSHLSWRYFNPDESESHEVQEAPLANADGTPAYCQEQLHWYEESWDIPEDAGRDLFHTMSVAYYDMLYDTLTKGTALTVTLAEVRQQIAVMEACFRQNERFSSTPVSTGN